MISLFAYTAPRTIEAVLDVLSQSGDDATILAGGQSLLILVRQRLVVPTVLVGLDRVEGLRTIRSRDGRLVVGAMATYAAVATDDLVRRHAPLLARAAGEVGSVHIRNRGTVGGAICHADPAGDVATISLVHGAEFVAIGRDGAARYRSDEFFTGLFETRLTGSGSVLVDVELDPVPDGATFGYSRHCHRAGEYPMCVAACRLEWDGDRCIGARVALGGGADRPMRLSDAEAALTGKSLSAGAIEGLLDSVRESLDPPPDVRGGSRWKARVAQRVLISAVTEAVEDRARGGIGNGNA